MTTTTTHEAAGPEQVLSLAAEIATAAEGRIRSIRQITTRTRTLSLNALIEAARAGEVGRGFAVVAQEVKEVSTEVAHLSDALDQELSQRLGLLQDIGRRMVEEVRGQRLVDLALNAIEIIDRNLYERTCDVRWWATDSAVVQCLEDRHPKTKATASERLGVILDAYTVYLDLWIADRAGTVIANGRPARYPGVAGLSVAGEAWFRDALAASGDAYAVADIAVNKPLGGVPVATYSAPIRQGGHAHGAALGVLGIQFDWHPQSQAVVDGVRIAPHLKDRTRVALVDPGGIVLASSDRRGVLHDRIVLPERHGLSGFHQYPDGRIVAWHATPGYETYRGLGWLCVIEQRA